MPGKALLPLAAALLWLSGSAQALDNKRYCDSDGGNVVLYLDVTTPYDDTDKRALVEGIAGIFEGLRGGERLSIRTIEDSFPKSVRLLEACVPSCPGGVLDDLFSDCTEGVVINDTKALRRQIVDALAPRLSGPSELLQSEIIRTLALSSAEEFREGRANAIYVFSDMIENSAYLSGADFFATENAALVARLADEKLVPNLLHADIGVFGVGRGGGEKRGALTQERLRKLLDFWEMFFLAAGAEVRLSQNLSAAD
jgi:hypothetical protein